MSVGVCILSAIVCLPLVSSYHAQASQPARKENQCTARLWTVVNVRIKYTFHDYCSDLTCISVKYQAGLLPTDRLIYTDIL